MAEALQVEVLETKKAPAVGLPVRPAAQAAASAKVVLQVAPRQQTPVAGWGQVLGADAGEGPDAGAGAAGLDRQRAGSGGSGSCRWGHRSSC